MEQENRRDDFSVKRIYLMLFLVCCAATLCSCGVDNNSVAVTVNSTGYPIVSEPITIRVVAPEWNNEGDFNEMQMVQEYEEKTNIHVEWILFNDSNMIEVLNRELSRENIPDVFLMAELPYMDSYKDRFLAVDELIEQYAPNIKKAMEVDPVSEKICTEDDGHMYAVPSFYRSKSEALRGIPFINKKWLDKLGLEMPETPDELYTVLKAFKERDPNGNGQNDEIPILFDWEYNMTGIGSMFAPWGVSSAFTGNAGESGPYIIKNDTEVVLSNAEQGYRDAVNYFHRLYEEGLLYNKSFTIDASMTDALVSGGNVGVFTDYSAVSGDYVPLLPLRGTDQGYMKQNAYGIFANNYISADTQYPEAVIRWMDGTAEPEQSYLWNSGPLGVNVEIVDGKYKKITDENGNPLPVSETFSFPVMGLYSGWIEENTVFSESAEIRNDIVDQFSKYTEAPYTSYSTVDFLKLKDETLSNEMIKIIEYSTQKEVEFIIRGDIDAKWNEHIEELRTMRAYEVLDALQEALNTWNAE